MIDAVHLSGADNTCERASVMAFPYPSIFGRYLPTIGGLLCPTRKKDKITAFYILSQNNIFLIFLDFFSDHKTPFGGK